MAKVSLRTWENRQRNWRFWLVTAFGAGMLRPAPGTWGSAVAAVAGYFMLLNGVDAIEMACFVFAVTILSVKAINVIEADTGIHDAPEIVSDEVAGQWIAFLPLVGMTDQPILFVTAFLLFRLFDIVKPWPIGWLDRKVDGGWGVMVDDLVAGIFAAIGIWVLMKFGITAFFDQLI